MSSCQSSRNAAIRGTARTEGGGFRSVWTAGRREPGDQGGSAPFENSHLEVPGHLHGHIHDHDSHPRPQHLNRVGIEAEHLNG